MAATEQYEWPEPKFVDANGIRIAYHEKGEGTAVLLLHGFPEIAFSWRHQLAPIAAAGFRVVAPDQRGYGLTSAPVEVESYDIAHLTADVVGLMDALGIEQAVVCGHDWGGSLAWAMTDFSPERVLGVIGVNVPLTKRAPASLVELSRRRGGENNYIVQFQKPGVADKVLGENVEKSFRIFFKKSRITSEMVEELPPDAPQRSFNLLDFVEKGEMDQGELVIPEEELKFYIDTFKRTGFTGGLKWYRNLDRNWEMLPKTDPKVEVPCLYIGAAYDYILPPKMANGMENLAPDLEKYIVKESGHWTQQEQPEEVNKVIVDWLSRRFGTGSGN